MDPIDKAIEEIESRGPGEEFSYRKIAKKYGVPDTTLRRIHQGKNLTGRRLPPTREMLQNFALLIAKTNGEQLVGKSWVTRFINCYNVEITPYWVTGIDRARHQADLGAKYEQFFQLLLEKMEEYNIEPRHTYNMDEKGFLTGVIGRSKRIFSKAMWDRGEVKSALQDGNREWMTILACVCANRTALPPGLLFAAANNALQSAWVEDIEAGKHVENEPSAGWQSSPEASPITKIYSISNSKSVVRSYP
ncbi:hypothetical protein BU23DRAFT_578852 [Bimuria novae-zelandiae CBS 107.79]|uniref:HTH CENPB-type domain-containing protein n=1 Tax=Bimuria novae-zelandiae CBS 107.79 TaxID=1447943 RepID=A0A6A5VFW3_9PLEO|nr:hypothetical protein BU23DRAFT_578852 [Bimuria novae-zelandiae CBS 107.79]